MCGKFQGPLGNGASLDRFIGHRVTELQSHQVTDTQGYSVYGWVKFFVPGFNKLPYLLCSQGDNAKSTKIRAYSQMLVGTKTLVWHPIKLVKALKSYSLRPCEYQAKNTKGVDKWLN